MSQTQNCQISADDGHLALCQLVHLPQRVRRESQQRLAAEAARLQSDGGNTVQNMCRVACCAVRDTLFTGHSPQTKAEDVGRQVHVAAALSMSPSRYLLQTAFVLTSLPCWCAATASGREMVVLPTTSPSTPSRSVSAAMSCAANQWQSVSRCMLKTVHASTAVNAQHSLSLMTSYADMET